MKKILSLILIMSMFILVGCGEKKDATPKEEGSQTTEQTSNDEKEKPKEEIKENENKDKTNNDIEKEKEDSNGTKTEVTDKKDPEKVKVKTLNVNMYFYDVINDKWVKEKTKVKSDRIKDLVIEVRNNKKSGIPKKTKVYSVTIKDKIATVDLGREFLDPQTNSSAGATAKVYSIVNTLCLNKNLGIDGVMFLIDGKKSETIGPIDNTRVLKPMGV